MEARMPGAGPALVLHLGRLLLCLLLGLLLLLHLFLLLQRGHDLGHLAGGDVDVLFVHQLDDLCTSEGTRGSGGSAPHGRGSPQSTAGRRDAATGQAGPRHCPPQGLGSSTCPGLLRPRPPTPRSRQTPEPRPHTAQRGARGVGSPRPQAWAGCQLGLPGPRATGRGAVQPRGCRCHQGEDAGPRPLVFWVRVPTGLGTQEPQRRRSPQASDKA